MNFSYYAGPEDKEDAHIPRVPPELVAYLRKIFPDRCPRLVDAERAIWAAVGARGVVAHLEALLEQQHSRLT